MGKSYEEEENSFWKACVQAVDKTIDQGAILGVAYDVEDMIDNLKDIKPPSRRDLEFLYRRAAIQYMEVYLNQINHRGLKRQTLMYASEDVHSQIIRNGFALNEQRLADSFQAKADDLALNADTLVVADTGIDHQLNILGQEERNISDLISEIRKMKESAKKIEERKGV